MLIVWAILSKVKFLVGGSVVFWPIILSILVLIGIRIKTLLWQFTRSCRLKQLTACTESTDESLWNISNKICYCRDRRWVPMSWNLFLFSFFDIFWRPANRLIDQPKTPWLPLSKIFCLTQCQDVQNLMTSILESYVFFKTTL